MDKRFFMFLALSMAILFGFQALISVLYPPADKPIPRKVAEKDAVEPGKGIDGEPRIAGVKGQDNGGEADPIAQPQPDAEPDIDPPVNDDGVPAVVPEVADLRTVTLGSLDPKSPARMLVYLTSRGAAVERVFLNNPRYQDIEDRSGFLGPLTGSDTSDGGCRVGVVGPGTPADLAGLKAGDIVTAVDGKPVRTAAALTELLKDLPPETVVKLSVDRDEKPIGPLSATLARRPLQIIRPEFGAKPLASFVPGHHDQLSLLLTFERIDDELLLPSDNELPGVGLRDQNWTITQQTPWEVEFSRQVPERGLSVVKRYRLAKVPGDEIANQDYKAYHLVLDIEIRNTGSEPKRIAYQLDGPSGLPTEGWWYSNKIGRNWGGRRLRDVAYHTLVDGPVLIDNSTIISEHEEGGKPMPLDRGDGQANPLAYLGVETQYFATIMIPERAAPNVQLFSKVETLLVGDIPLDKAKRQLSNISSRMVSEPVIIQPGRKGQPGREGQPGDVGALKQTFVVFAGPKRRELLEQYGPDPNMFPKPVNLAELIYYGWTIWGFFAFYLSQALHLFYSWTGNYGVAIIMLTVVVRLCMFPLSRKQALNAQKMQELQPEIKKISEKYKSDMEKRSKAIQEVYKKNNYNPLAGCFPLFIQLPIFLGLYRSLMTDIELRQAPLISDSVAWANNLGAPDMLWRWEGLLPFLITETGFLGPYLNVLPLITVVLFIWQQKMFMPPPTDDQAALQQKMMQYMMIFFGFLFFRVPSGLCLYFIVSSLWGLGERKLLPKAPVQEQTSSTATGKAERRETAKSKPLAKAGAAGGGKRRKK